MFYEHIQFHDTRHGNMSQIAQIESIREDNESEYAGYDIHKQCCKDIGKHIISIIVKMKKILMKKMMAC
ncbi:13184_t:CDS:2 [Funneliformis geosporum]|uniref:13683_t:CDS:1 n=1 Tax=Funneliformis geosporum TaxID=1117311 RepID=A0A9W4WT31_9GLOM|nr:13683_t:CDS:2 [Funneliformis geosporum]CAI2175955.1 13184_t:CDS:2 [Funneliformis geosporum]